MSLNVLVLESVGSCIDEDGTVYPMNVDGTPDTNCGVDWVETSDEWSEAVSNEDSELLDNWLTENNYSVNTESVEELESLVDNNPDDGSWEGR